MASDPSRRRCGRLPVAVDFIFDHHRSSLVTLLVLVDLASVLLPVLAATITDELSASCADAAVALGLDWVDSGRPALEVFRVLYIATALAAASQHYRLAIWGPLALVFGSVYLMLLFTIEAPACGWLINSAPLLSINGAPLHTVAAIRICLVVLAAVVVIRIAALLVVAWRHVPGSDVGSPELPAPPLSPGASVLARLLAAGAVFVRLVRRLYFLVPLRHKLAVAITLIVVVIGHGFIDAAAAGFRDLVKESGAPSELVDPVLKLTLGIEVGGGLALAAVMLLLVDSCAAVAADVSALRSRYWAVPHSTLPPARVTAEEPFTDSAAVADGSQHALSGDKVTTGANGSNAEPFTPAPPAEPEDVTSPQVGAVDDSIVLISDPDAVRSEAAESPEPGAPWYAGLLASLRESVSLRYRAIPGTMRKTPGFTADGCIDVTHAVRYAAASDYLVMFITNAVLAFGAAAVAFTIAMWLLLFEATRNLLLEIAFFQVSEGGACLRGAMPSLSPCHPTALCRSSCFSSAGSSSGLSTARRRAAAARSRSRVSFSSSTSSCLSLAALSTAWGRAGHVRRSLELSRPCPQRASPARASLHASRSTTQVRRTECVTSTFAEKNQHALVLPWGAAFCAYAAMLKCTCADLIDATNADAVPPRRLDDDHADVLATLGDLAGASVRGWQAAAALPALALQPPPPAAGGPPLVTPASAPLADPLSSGPLPAARAPRTPWGGSPAPPASGWGGAPPAYPPPTPQDSSLVLGGDNIHGLPGIPPVAGAEQAHFSSEEPSV